MLIHSGDFAYDIKDNHGLKGDEYFENQSQNNKQVAYLIIPGNHETIYQGNLLNYRFQMPMDKLLK